MTLILILLLLLAVMLFCGVPVALSLFLAASTILFTLDIPLVVAVQRMAAGVNIFTLMAIPLFILAGELMTQAGIARRLVRLSESTLGPAPGGLGQVTILASMLFGAVSGSALASASAMGSALGPEMRQRGFDPDYVVNVSTSASITGLLIPPSHNMIIYATAAGTGISIGDLFLGGILPGIVTGLTLMVVAAIVATKRGYPRGHFPGWRALIRSAAVAFPGILTALIILFGILAGIFTPTESAAIACTYTIVVGAFVYRELDLTRLIAAFMNSARTTIMVMFIIATASLFGWVLAVLQAPAQLAELLAPAMANPFLTLILIAAMLLVLGTFMDMAPLILITTPIFLPIATSVGMAPVQFGVMLMLALGIGLLTPPVGSVLFVGCASQGIPVGQALRTIWPFYLALLVALIMVIAVPGLSLWLPQVFS
ncbi:TRAP transporter large permease [Altericroceibacterium endophyticum]|uniref:TRAP transporter large permease protein n=1 Tax=Altericroceibacterium endophyticum TaxID=1808508 RepID=A0A6I4T2E1_9SPHN|nr:TRAP transporter large permease [Altericroceibacterium endophyticum]MXO64502.1 TRAP transporter large permease subunit [Altericroceibacterium endophyticum]